MAEPFSLLSDAWIPVLRSDGTREIVRPAAITSDIDTNPIVAPAWGRADFDAATREFWIGLLAVACGQQAHGRGWTSWFRKPPSPDDLDAAFAPLATAFVLDGDGPRFGQDRADIAGETVAVSQLLIEAPGANTVKRNLDHFIRRGEVATLSRAGAAIALFTLHTYAPSGGAGHRVSVRGGGPLTTLLVPGSTADEAGPRPVPLWRILWLATPEYEEPAAPERVFPWLVPTRVSDKGQSTSEADVDPRQAFWGMPRRIRLDFEENHAGLPCDLTGRVDPILVRAYRTRPHGTSYSAFLHRLSPHYRGKTTEPFLPVHGQPGRIGYRHWVGLVVDDTGGGEFKRAAAAVTTGRQRLGGLGPAALSGTRLLAAGYDMDNMKARAFIESELPLHLVARHFGRFDETVRLLVGSASEAEDTLRSFVRQALFVKRTQVVDGFTKAPREGGALDLARARFWERTEVAFGRALASLASAIEALPEGGDTLAVKQDAAEGWLRVLRTAAVALFDELVPLEDLDALDERSARARIEARHDLHGTLAGYGKRGQALFTALGLAPPEVQKKRKANA